MRTRFHDNFLSREDCPVCSSRRHEILFSGPLTSPPVRNFIESHYRHQEGQLNWNKLNGVDYILCDCLECGLIYQRHIPSVGMLHEIYDVMIGPAFLQKLELRRLTVDNFEQIAGELDVLFRIIGKHPADTQFLDFGFGHGRWARVAVAMGANVFATELSPEKIAYANRIGVTIIDDDAISGMRFDIIHAEQVFEHLTHPREDFKRLAGALAPGGIMKVAVPPQQNIRRLLKTHGMIDWSPGEDQWNPRGTKKRQSRYSCYVCIQPLEHLNAYSSKAMDLLAKENNLRLISHVRRQSISLNTLKPALLLRSLLQLSKVTLRPILRRDSGYYIFTPN
jgi:2-polyprenyl-3-methyl-5-hydroxy-6-metoxy-1,4-benzoquinol methylase